MSYLNCARPFVDALRAYFEQFAPVESVLIVKTTSGISRGFGFVSFYDSEIVPKLFQNIHVLDQCQVRLLKLNIPIANLL